MSSLKHEQLPFSLPFKPAQTRDHERDVTKEQLGLSTDEDSEFLPDASDMKSHAEINNQRDVPPSGPSATHFDHDVSSSSAEEAEQRPDARTNRYKGPPSTWLSWTASERGIAASLDQLKARDLAVHLYNAHHLKRRAIRSQLMNNEDESATRQEWKPSSSWTAWPLEPDVAPNGNDCPEWAGEDFCRPDHSHDRHRAQRQELQDLLVARFLKISKQRNEELRQQPERGEPESTDTGLQTESTGGLDINSDLEPVTMMDDDVAKDILLPTVCHMLTKVDQLLIGLHHARDTYAYKSGRFRNEKSKRKRSISDSRTIAPDTSGPESGHSSQETRKSNIHRTHEGSRLPSRHNQRRAPKEKLAQRDWVDVLGVASMTGWGSKPVRKTAHRCSTLFGEGIKLRKLEENGDDPIETMVLPGALFSSDDSTDDEKMVEEYQRSRPSPGPVEETEPGWKMYCSVEGCKRSTRGFMDYRAVKRHFKTVHPGVYVPEWPLTEENDDEALGKQRSSPLPGPVENETLVWKMHCPVDSCRRSSQGFMDYRAFKRHVQEVHPDVKVPQRSQIEEEDENDDESDDESEGEMFGGVHVDGFLQRIEAVSWWTAPKRIRPPSRPRSRRSKG